MLVFNERKGALTHYHDVNCMWLNTNNDICEHWFPMGCVTAHSGPHGDDDGRDRDGA